MKQFKVIDQLNLVDGVLMCKKPSKRSWQKAHFKQGDLDGACGVYSIAMSLNILGVFKADDFNSDPDDVDNRKGKYRLINALNEYGLYRRGLKGHEIIDILTKHFSKKVSAIILLLRGSPGIITVSAKSFNFAEMCAVGVIINSPIFLIY